jgi:hypothetical protein
VVFPIPPEAAHDRAPDRIHEAHEPRQADRRQALESLRYIRDTMEGASSFTAVPGWGGAVMGVSALVAAFLASRETDPAAWLLLWLLEAAVAVTIGVLALFLKARASGSRLFSGPGRKFFLGLVPPLVAGAVLTLALARAGRHDLLAGAWLLAYGTAVVTGGQSSTRAVPTMGVLLMTIGSLALLLPVGLGDVYLAAGFGALQLAFGLLIAWRHGG